MSTFPDKKNDKKRKNGGHPNKFTWLGISLTYLYLKWQLKPPEVQPLMPRNLLLGSCFRFILCFSMWNNPWIYLDFVAICSATSHPFGFPCIRKRLPPDILKFLVIALRNQNRKFSFIRVDKYGALEISPEFMKTCHNMNTIVQTTGRYAS